MMGGIFSLITFVLTILLVTYNLTQWINDSDPRTNTSIEYKDPTTPENIPFEFIEAGLGYTVITDNADPRAFNLTGKNMKNVKYVL